MIVWIVSEVDDENQWHIVKVFSSREKAINWTAVQEPDRVFRVEDKVVL